MNLDSKQSRQGFTLVELLVVILIMTILLTVGASALRGVGGKGVATAMSATEALFEEARAVAVGKGTRTRILVDVDDPTAEGYLRRIAIVYEELDEDGIPKTDFWKLAARSYNLPDKVYFSRVFSKTDHDNETGDLEEMELIGNGGNYNGRYVFYEFNSEGICTTGLSEDGTVTGPSFVIGSGARPPGGEPRVVGDGRRNFGGFVIWRNGSTSVFRDPKQIIKSSQPSQF